MITSSEWSLYSVLQLSGVWAAAFATYFAARTAIRISQEQSRVHLIPSADIGYLISFDAAQIPMIEFSVTNVGLRDATLTGFRLSHWLLKRKLFIIGFNFTYGDKLPCRISTAETKSFFLGVGTPHEEWARGVAEDVFSGRGRLGRWIALKTLKVVAQCGNGIDVQGRPNKRLVELLSKISVSGVSAA